MSIRNRSLSIALLLIVAVPVSAQYELELKVETTLSQDYLGKSIWIWSPAFGGATELLFSNDIKDTIYTLPYQIDGEEIDLEIQLGISPSKKLKLKLDLDSLASKYRIVVKPFWDSQKDNIIEIQKYYCKLNQVQIHPEGDLEINEHPAFSIKNCSDYTIYNCLSKKAFNGTLVLPDGSRYEGIDTQFGGRNYLVRTQVSEYNLDPGETTFSFVGVYDSFKYKEEGIHKFEIKYNCIDYKRKQVKRSSRMRWEISFTSIYYQDYEFYVNDSSKSS